MYSIDELDTDPHLSSRWSISLHSDRGIRVNYMIAQGTYVADIEIDWERGN